MGRFCGNIGYFQSQRFLFFTFMLYFNFAMTTSARPKALALYSGGLDSTLAILILLEQKIEVEALSFVHDFGCGKNREHILETAKRFGFSVNFITLEEEFINMVKNPKHGYGKNMNPCIDCRILMLKKAKEYARESGASFFVTGEVLNQRPLSQKRNVLKLIDREAGLEGYVLRPLSALNLEPTIPEKEGLVKRELLFGFEGRSRKPQIALAKKFGLIDYPQPAGGCLLTDPIYSLRFKELLKMNPNPSPRDIKLLGIGRHFRLSQSCKVIVGRNRKENEILERIANEGDFILKASDYPGPTLLIAGTSGEAEWRLAASICARYSDGKNRGPVKVTIYRPKSGEEISKTPVAEYTIETIDYDTIEKLLIAPLPYQKSL